MGPLIGISDLPIGLTMLLAEDEDAMAYFVALPEAEKKRLIDYIQEAKTGEEARRRIEEVVELCKKYDSYF